MKILLTSGSTREPIDAVRFFGNRSSGRMGVAIATAAMEAGHEVTAIVGVASVEMPAGVDVTRVETTRQMHDAVLSAWPDHDLLIMAAAVADYRPVQMHHGKLRRDGSLTLQLEATEDILAAAGAMKTAGQRAIGFSLDEDNAEARDRAASKLAKKNLDLIVYNPLGTMDAETIAAELIWPGGRREAIRSRDKAAFADVLIEHAGRLFADSPT